MRNTNRKRRNTGKQGKRHAIKEQTVTIIINRIRIVMTVPIAVSIILKKTEERTNSRGKNTLEETLVNNSLTKPVGLNSKRIGTRDRQIKREGLNVKPNTVRTNQAKTACSMRVIEGTRRKTLHKAGKRTLEATIHLRSERPTRTGNK